MPMGEIFDWIMRGAVALGVPTLLGKYIRDGLRSRAARRRDNTEAEVVEAIAEDRIKSSSITTLEAQHVATQKAWDAERTALKGTIDFQAVQLTEAREYARSRDDIISELRARVEELQGQLAEIAGKLADLQN